VGKCPFWDWIPTENKIAHTHTHTTHTHCDTHTHTHTHTHSNHMWVGSVTHTHNTHTHHTHTVTYTHTQLPIFPGALSESLAVDWVESEWPTALVILSHSDSVWWHRISSESCDSYSYVRRTITFWQYAMTSQVKLGALPAACDAELAPSPIWSAWMKLHSESVIINTIISI